MFKPSIRTIGDEIFLTIEKDQYLNELYQLLLYNYGLKLFNQPYLIPDDKQIKNALRFADLLSKSTDQNHAGIHKVWAQEIISLLDVLVPNNEDVKFYMYSVLSNCTNYYALKEKKLDINGSGFLEDLSNESRKEFLKVPHHDDEHFFFEQKNIFDTFDAGNFSYSAPTSMGKSFIMRVFIRNKIELNQTSNFAILVPTKALINEVKRKVLSELKGQLTEKNYRVVTSVGDIVLEQEHHFIFIMTPERLLYLINSKPEMDIDYLFIDEAHKICVNDSRSAFYYQLVDILSKRANKPFIYFSSPNIPNPDVYTKLIPENQLLKVRTEYAPVNQFKFLIDEDYPVVKIYNEHSKQFTDLSNNETALSLIKLINMLTVEDKQTLVYCSSLADAVQGAVEYSKDFPQTTDTDLISIANDIESQIHSEYYLVDLIRKGVAFHVGYLPASIKLRIEDAFIKGKIKVIFCTSTLVEGVNLPADNLIITSYRNGTASLDPVSFRNLIGRVGRLEFSMFGNVILYRCKKGQKIKKFEELLTDPIPDQKLSIETAIETRHKKALVESLARGDISLSNRPETTNDQYQFMRKISMLLIDNVVNDNTSSLVVSSLLPKETQVERIKQIKQHYGNEPKVEGLDLTYDQYRNLRNAIADGLTYPPQIIFKGEPAIDFGATTQFLQKLYNIFKWDIYETDNLAMHSLLPYYASIINQWMSGYGLGSIMTEALKYKKNHPTQGVYVKHRKVLDYYEHTNKDHKNLVFVEVLNLIEHMVLFNISNYFRAFSMEYKRQHNITDHFDNDWYEYIEYGTMKSTMIYLQRVGYSRESATFILNQKNKFMDTSKQSTTAPFVLRRTELLNCRDEGVKIETEDIFINVPELFID